MELKNFSPLMDAISRLGGIRAILRNPPLLDSIITDPPPRAPLIHSEIPCYLRRSFDPGSDAPLLSRTKTDDLRSRLERFDDFSYVLDESVVSRFRKSASDGCFLGIDGDIGPNYGRKFGDPSGKVGFYDGPYALNLTRGKSLSNMPVVATLSFCAVEDTLHVVQIQAREKIPDLRWARLLVDRLEDFARFYEIPRVRISGAKNVSWPQISSSSKPGQHGHTIYDVTALRSGYKKIENGDYEKVL